MSLTQLPLTPYGQGSTLCHATSVALGEEAGVLVIGPSGCGKSALALELISLGATLVCDDQTVLSRDGDALIATPAPNIAGQIEARGIGILTVPYLERTRVRAVVDLGRAEEDRLPPSRNCDVMGASQPLIRRPQGSYLAAALILLLKGGRAA